MNVLRILKNDYKTLMINFGRLKSQLQSLESNAYLFSQFKINLLNACTVYFTFGEYCETNNPNKEKTDKPTRKYDKMEMRLSIVEREMTKNLALVQKSDQIAISTAYVR